MLFTTNTTRVTPPNNQPVLTFVADEAEFILYCTSTHIHRMSLNMQDDVTLPTGPIREAVALDYDYANHCVFWADPDEDVIKVNLAPCEILAHFLDNCLEMILAHLFWGQLDPSAATRNSHCRQ